MSVLQPSTLALLVTVRPCAPFFSNMILAELFDDAHTRGRFYLLPFADGGYVVFDPNAPNGKGALEHHSKLEDAHAALERIAAT